MEKLEDKGNQRSNRNVRLLDVKRILKIIIETDIMNP
jgi:hypothetical protein